MFIVSITFHCNVYYNYSIQRLWDECSAVVDECSCFDERIWGWAL